MSGLLTFDGSNSNSNNNNQCGYVATADVLANSMFLAGNAIFLAEECRCAASARQSTTAATEEGSTEAAAAAAAAAEEECGAVESSATAATPSSPLFAQGAICFHGFQSAEALRPGAPAPCPAQAEWDLWRPVLADVTRHVSKTELQQRHLSPEWQRHKAERDQRSRVRAWLLKGVLARARKGARAYEALLRRHVHACCTVSCARVRSRSRSRSRSCCRCLIYVLVAA